MTDPDEPLLTWDYHMLWHDDLHCETLNALPRTWCIFA